MSCQGVASSEPTEPQPMVCGLSSPTTQLEITSLEKGKAKSWGSINASRPDPHGNEAINETSGSSVDMGDGLKGSLLPAPTLSQVWQKLE